MRNLLFIAAGAVLCAGGALGYQHAPPKPPRSKRLVYRDVQPILKFCASCHKPPKPAHGLDLTTYAAIMKGDRSGKVVVAGRPSKSRLATVLHGKPQLMPPGGALEKAQIAKIEAWIKAGARER